VPDDSPTASQGSQYHDSPGNGNTYSNKPEEGTNGRQRVTSPEDPQQAEPAPARTSGAANDPRKAPRESALILSREWQTDAQQLQNHINSVKSTDRERWISGAEIRAESLKDRLKKLSPNEEQNICKSLMDSIMRSLKAPEPPLRPSAESADNTERSRPTGESNGFGRDRAAQPASGDSRDDHTSRPPKSANHQPSSRGESSETACP
jgi:hypothetical protein